mmetsp:Transcript_10482/g.22266  ORF Transcript_10482/g.22266 Transcript_10482/m.22266 type:complete len:211 (+) Transcript_10482:115-747(+)
MDRAELLNEIEAAFATWGAALDGVLHFGRVPASRKAEATLEIVWSEAHGSNPLLFDGPGGKLAHADASVVAFDPSERWLLQGQNKPEQKKGFFLLPVLLHELGHSLGLVHSNDPESIMSPYYVPERIAVSARDRARIKAVYERAGAGGGAGGATSGAILSADDAHAYVEKHALEEHMTNALNLALRSDSETPLLVIANYFLEKAAEANAK